MAKKVHIRVKAGSRLIRPNLHTIEDVVRPITVVQTFEVWATPIRDDEGVMYEFGFRGMLYSVTDKGVEVLTSRWQKLIDWLGSRR